MLCLRYFVNYNSKYRYWHFSLALYHTCFRNKHAHAATFPPNGERRRGSPLDGRTVGRRRRRRWRRRRKGGGRREFWIFSPAAAEKGEGRGRSFFPFSVCGGIHIRVTPPPPPLRSPPSDPPQCPRRRPTNNIFPYMENRGKGGKTVFLVRESDGIVK